MLIVLSDSLRVRDLRPPLARDARDALLNLSTAAYEGTHLLAGTRLLFGTLQQLTELGPVVTGRFKEASPGGAEAMGLTTSVATMIHVEPLGSPPRVAHRDPGTAHEQVVFHLPLEHFAESSRIGCSYLLGEHSRDATFYVALGEAAATRHRGLRCNLRCADGQGGATFRTFRLLVDQCNCVLCIVDSDRDHATDVLKQTAAQVVACCESARAACKVAMAHVLPCRELENLIPPRLVLDALPNDPRDPRRIRVLAAESRLGLADFAELKELVKLEDISEHFRRLSPHKRAELCLSGDVHPALENVRSHIWSFGLASRRGRT